LFDGEYKHTIDAKGRLMIPSKYRDEIHGETLCIVTAFSNCLSVYPESAYREHTRSLSGISSTDKKGMFIKRYILSNTREVALDQQGRILIGQEQREKANLKKDVVLVGSDDYFEIWDAAEWQQMSAFGSPEEMAAMATELGITF
jgi:MraZ protein